MIYYDYRQDSLSSNAPKLCQTTLGIILHSEVRFTSGTSNFSSAERLLKTVTAAGQIVAKVICLIKEGPRISENKIKDSSVLLIFHREA